MAALAGTVLSAATVSIGYLYRRVHEMRDRIRDLEEELERIRPVTDIIRQAVARQTAAIFKGGRKHA